MANEINGTDDVIDVRDVIERIEELREALEEAFEANEEGHNFETLVEYRAAVRLDASPAHCHRLHMEEEELADLEALMDELKGYGGDEQWEGDWYPLTLIARDHFVEYIKELIHDCYEMPKQTGWPYDCMHMDYEQAAEAAEVDYSTVEFRGYQFLYR